MFTARTVVLSAQSKLSIDSTKFDTRCQPFKQGILLRFYPLIGQHHPVVGKLSAADFLEFGQQVGYFQVFLLLARHIVYDMALVHHDQTVAVYDGVLHIVGDHQGGQLILANDAVGGVQYLGRGFRIQGCQKRSKAFLKARYYPEGAGVL